MQPLVPCLATIYDRNAEFLGVNITKLMGNAGKAVAKVLQEKYKLTDEKIQIFCGSGNNGGDGFALGAELLGKDLNVEIILATPDSQIRSRAARHHFTRLPARIIRQYSSQVKADGNILIDALLGVGMIGKLKPPFDQIVRRLRKAKGRLVSLDIPTGNLEPQLCIAFHCSKNSKQEIVVPIGILKKAETHFGPGDIQAYFPIREPDSHKGQNGQVIIVGGSNIYLGAPIFAALGAVGGGADLVDLFVPAVNFAATRKHSPNVLTAKLAGNPDRLTPEAVPKILELVEKTGATLILGPGLGKNKETQQAIRQLVQKNKNPLILDTDAILPAAELCIAPTIQRPVILTPHAGEFRRLTGDKPNRITVMKWAQKLGVTILLKGREDIITAPDGRQRYNDIGSPILTTGGTGDTLAGLVGSLLSRTTTSKLGKRGSRVRPFEAAGLAAFILGYAGKELAKKQESVTPQQLARSFPKIIQGFLNIPYYTGT